MPDQSSRGVSRQVLQYLKQYPNQRINIEDMASTLKVTLDTTKNALSYLKNAHEIPIARPTTDIVVLYGSESEAKTKSAVTSTQKVRDFFLAHPHQTVSIDDIIVALHLSNNQASSVVSQLRKRHRMPIEHVMNGVYRYSPAKGELAKTLPALPIVSELPPVEIETTEVRQRPMLVDPVKIAEREAEVTRFIENQNRSTMPTVGLWPAAAPLAQPVPVPTQAPTLTKVKQQGGHVYEEIGTTKDGKVLVRDDEGVIYYLEQL